MDELDTKVPKAFMSYSWADELHRAWVRNLAARLRSDGVEVMLDQWHLAPGDQLPGFMELAVRENDFVLIVCTPDYKKRSDGRIGGVGHEGDIMTAEVLTDRNERKFIPLLRLGEWRTAAPSWLSGKYYVDFRGQPYSEDGYLDLILTLHGQREQAPPVGPAPIGKFARRQQGGLRNSSAEKPSPTEPIRIKGVIVDEVSFPRNGRTGGSALYAIPFQLSYRPSPDWAQLFVREWDSPPRFTPKHRPGFARVEGDRIVLDGTTIEEVEQAHRDTLKLVVDRVNGLIAEHRKTEQHREDHERQKLQAHKDAVNEVSNRLRFE